MKLEKAEAFGLIAIVSFLILGGFWVLSAFGFEIPLALSILDFLCGIAFSIKAVLPEQAPLPVGVRALKHLLIGRKHDTPEMLREGPIHLVDLKDGYIIQPHETTEKLLSKLAINMLGFPPVEDSTTRFRAAALFGPSGCGKSTISIRLGYTLAREGWSVFYSELPDVSCTTIESIQQWLCSLKGWVLFVIDDVHLDPDYSRRLVQMAKSLEEQGQLHAMLRVLLIGRHSLAIAAGPRPVDDEVVKGKRVYRQVLDRNKVSGMVARGRVTEKPYPSIEPWIKTLLVIEGREIAEGIFAKFGEVTGTLTNVPFEDLFRQAGGVVEFCELLRMIRNKGIRDQSGITSEIWSELAGYSLERRLAFMSDRESGVKTLGILSEFTAAGSLVARAFLDDVISSGLGTCIKELQKERNITTRHMGPSEMEFVMLTHSAVAKLIRKACIPVLVALSGAKSAEEVDLLLYARYLDYLQALSPAITAGRDSEFLLCVSSFAAQERNAVLSEFVLARCKKWLNPDASVMYSLYNVGNAFFSMGQFDEAAEALKSALNLDPEFDEARVNLGVVRYMAGDLDAARDEITHVIKRGFDTASANSTLAIVLWERGDMDEALACSTRGTELEPQTARFWHNRANLETEMGLFSEAEQHAREAARLDLKDPEIRVCQSMILLKQQRHEEAVALLRNAIESGLKSLKILINLGHGLKMLGRLEEAESVLLEGFQMAPGSTLIQENLADVAQKQKRWNLAIHYGMMAEPNDPNNAVLQGILGMAFMGQGKLTEAEEHARRAVGLEPTNPEIHLLLGVILRAKGEDPEPEFREAVSLGSKDEQALLLLAQLLFDKKRPSEAENLLRQMKSTVYRVPKLVLLGRSLGAQQKVDEAIQVLKEGVLAGGENHQARFWYGIVLHRKGEDEQARLELLEAERIRPDHSGTKLALGEVLLDLGLVNDGVTRLEQAAQLDSGNPRIWFSLAHACYAIKDTNGLLRCWNKLIELQPGNAEWWNNLGSSYLSIGDLQKAKEALKKAQSLNPGLAEVWFNLGGLAHQGGRLAEAEGCFRKGLKLKPDTYHAWKQLEEILRKRGKIKDADMAARSAESLRLKDVQEYSKRVSTSSWQSTNWTGGPNTEENGSI